MTAGGQGGRKPRVWLQPSGTLADACRAALDASRVNVGAAAERALQRNAEPDLYGELHALASGQRDWLVACVHRAQGERS